MNEHAIDIEALIKEGKRRLNEPSNIDFATGVPEAEALYRDLNLYSHIFVLGCLMDRQIDAKRAWLVPYKIGQIAGGFEFSRFLAVTEPELIDAFSSQNLHRFKVMAAKHFYAAIQKIHSDYQDNASLIWSGTPRSARIVRKFLEFPGAGIKIATMAANILARTYKIPMQDYSSIDISPDVRVQRFFEHNKLIRLGASREEIIYRARELSPDYPGVFDELAWESGGKRKQK